MIKRFFCRMRHIVMVRRAQRFERVADELSRAGKNDAAVACLMMAAALLAQVEREKECRDGHV